MNDSLNGKTVLMFCRPVLSGAMSKMLLELGAESVRTVENIKKEERVLQPLAELATIIDTASECDIVVSVEDPVTERAEEIRLLNKSGMPIIHVSIS